MSKIRKVLKFAWFPKIIGGKFVFLCNYIEILEERPVKHLIVSSLSNSKWIETYEWDVIEKIPLRKIKIL